MVGCLLPTAAGGVPFLIFFFFFFFFFGLFLLYRVHVFIFFLETNFGNKSTPVVIYSHAEQRMVLTSVPMRQFIVHLVCKIMEDDFSIADSGEITISQA